MCLLSWLGYPPLFRWTVGWIFDELSYRGHQRKKAKSPDAGRGLAAALLPQRFTKRVRIRVSYETRRSSHVAYLPQDTQSFISESENVRTPGSSKCEEVITFASILDFRGTVGGGWVRTGPVPRNQHETTLTDRPSDSCGRGSRWCRPPSICCRCCRCRRRRVPRGVMTSAARASLER